MGQHNRSVSCRTCSATAPLKVAKTSWRPGSGRMTTWTCSACVLAQSRPASTLMNSIRLKPTALAELAARSRQPRADELMKLAQASHAAKIIEAAETIERPDPEAADRRRHQLLFGRGRPEVLPASPPRSRSTPALRGRMQIFAAAAMLGLVGMPVQRRNGPPTWLAELRADLDAAGGAVTLRLLPRSLFEQLEEETEHVVALGLKITPIPDHPPQHGERHRRRGRTRMTDSNFLTNLAAELGFENADEITPSQIMVRTRELMASWIKFRGTIESDRRGPVAVRAHRCNLRRHARRGRHADRFVAACRRVFRASR